MASNYVYFDATSATEHARDFYQIGIGPLRQPLILGECQYDKNPPKGCESQPGDGSKKITDNVKRDVLPGKPNDDESTMDIGIIIVILVLVIVTLAILAVYLYRRHKKNQGGLNSGIF